MTSTPGQTAVASVGLPKTCVAGANRTQLAQFESLVGFKINCDDVYDDAAPTWAAWEKPWFIGNNIQADNWEPFAKNPNNHLMITLGLIPDSVVDSNWRAAGAAGDYTQYAKVLARNLVKGHMADAVIRLATEANGTWEKDSIGNSPTQWKQWVQFWRKTVLAMRSVAGARFSFDWGINNGYRPIPFQDYYPGNDVVNSIGVDVYDIAPADTQSRFAYVKQESGGLAAIAAFAKKQGKPLIIPEWGIQPTSNGGAGDDPAFVNALASFIASTPVVSEAFFDSQANGPLLANSPASLKLYKADFRPGSTIVNSQ